MSAASGMDMQKEEIRICRLYVCRLSDLTIHISPRQLGYTTYLYIFIYTYVCVRPAVRVVKPDTHPPVMLMKTMNELDADVSDADK